MAHAPDRPLGTIKATSNNNNVLWPGRVRTEDPDVLFVSGGCYSVQGGGTDYNTIDAAMCSTVSDAESVTCVVASASVITCCKWCTRPAA